jgi:hypothetical protein
MKIPKIYYLLIILGVVLLVVIEYNRPEEVNWTPTYTSFDKIPLGTRVLEECLPELLPNGYYLGKYHEALPYTYGEEYSSSSNLLVIRKDFYVGKKESERITAGVNLGYNVLISAESIQFDFVDSLGIKTRVFKNFSLDSLSCEYNLNEHQKIQYSCPSQFVLSYFDLDEVIEEANVEVLGYCEGEPNLIKIGIGDGSLYLHTVPYVFSNYSLLYTNGNRYASGMVSLVNENYTYLYEQYPDPTIDNGILQFVKANTGLKYAWYLFIIISLVYLFFGGQRKQRIIPIVEPLKNRSKDFIYTLSAMYFRKGDHKDLANKQIILFQDYLREKYFISRPLNDTRLVEVLVKKSGFEESEIKSLLNYIQILQAKNNISSQELVTLYGRINKFKYGK